MLSGTYGPWYLPRKAVWFLPGMSNATGKTFFLSTLLCIYRFDTCFFLFLLIFILHLYILCVIIYFFCLSLFSFISSFMRNNLARSQTDCDGATYQYR